MKFRWLCKHGLILANILCFGQILAQGFDLGTTIADTNLGQVFDVLDPSTTMQTQTSTGYDLASIFGNIDAQINPIKNFIIGISYALGIGMCIIAVMKLKKYGTKTAYMHVESSLVGPFLQFFIGIALFYLPTFIESLNQTLWQDPDVNNVLSWNSGSQSDNFQTYIEPILGVIQIIGMIAFIRGWVQLSRATNAGQQPGAVSKGLTHIVGGILAINIYTVIEVFNQTFLG